jgi:cytoskeletal protein CcmA (bactofilin family)
LPKSELIMEDNELPEQSIVAPNTVLRGDLQTENDVRIFGTFEGNISCANCMIEEHGSVVGDIDAGTVSVAGNLRGEVTADNFIVSQTANIEGDITALRYGIEPGAIIPKATLSSPDLDVADANNRSERKHPRVVMPHKRSTKSNKKKENAN